LKIIAIWNERSPGEDSNGFVSYDTERYTLNRISEQAKASAFPKVFARDSAGKSVVAGSYPGLPSLREILYVICQIIYINVRFENVLQLQLPG
jgi:hypothetical protein